MTSVFCPPRLRGLRDGYAPATADLGPRMVDLDQEQRDVLMWILEHGTGDVVIAPIAGTDHVDLIIPRGPRRRLAGGDVARLVDLLLLQHVQRKVYRVTELGRDEVRSG